VAYDRDVTICLDFDGVLHDYKEREENFPTPGGNPVSGAKNAVAWLVEQNYALVIFSARANEGGGVEAIETWLHKWGFPDIRVSLEKPEAHLYVDDRGFRFDGSFTSVLSFLMKNPKPGRWGKDETSR
jgi:hypothetical protein